MKKLIFNLFGNVFLLVIVVLIIGNALLIYYMMNWSEYNASLPNETLENTNSQEVDTIANLLSNVIESDNTVQNVTVNANEAGSRKVMNENLIVLYNGLILDTTKMEQVELKYIDNTSIDKDKYVITYYNYENFAYMEPTLGKLSQPIYDNLVGIQGVRKIAISENYKAIPKDIKVINTLPTVILENNNKLTQYLDMNGTEEYVTILANKNTGYSKIAFYDSTGKFVADLAFTEKSKWNPQTHLEYYLSLENVNILDVDNDGIMEILVEIPKYETEPSVSILKYKNAELMGKTNIECSFLP